MNREDIIRMAREAGCEIRNGHIYNQYTGSLDQMLKRFAKLVSEKEREACAKVADQISDKYGWGYYGNEVDTADEIADAIRAKGKQ